MAFISNASLTLSAFTYSAESNLATSMLLKKFITSNYKFTNLIINEVCGSAADPPQGQGQDDELSLKTLSS